jgi:hypothetical protein
MVFQDGIVDDLEDKHQTYRNVSDHGFDPTVCSGFSFFSFCMCFSNFFQGNVIIQDWYILVPTCSKQNGADLLFDVPATHRCFFQLTHLFDSSPLTDLFLL